MASPSPRRKTALAFIAAFETLDATAFTSLLSPTYSHIMAPSSITLQSHSSGASFAAHITNLKSVIERFPVTAKEVMEDEQQNRVVVWATGEPKFYNELKDDELTEEEWVYRGEYIFMLSMNESGEKIERVVEFLDSKAVEQGMELVRRARGNLGRKGNF